MVYFTLKVDFELANDEYKVQKMQIDNHYYIGGQAKHIGNLLDWGEDVTFYVNNLNMFYIYLLKFLCDNDIKFDYSYKNGKCSNVKVEINGRKVFFVNFKSKFGVEFDEEENSENLKLIDYALEHGCNRLSLGADAYNMFLLTIFKPKPEEAANHELVREMFPKFGYDAMLLDAKRNAYGFQYCKTGWHDVGFEYDISSSYPASAMGNLPCGLPRYYKDIREVPASYFKIIKFTYYNAKLKSNGIDFVQIAHMGSLSLSEGLFNEFKRNYDATIKIIAIEAFKTRKSPLVQFLEQTIIRGKLYEKDPRIAAYNKLLGNAIIGYLGRNTSTIENTAYMTPQGLKLGKKSKNIDPIYLPAHVAILDAAKTRFLKVLHRFREHIIYANTDGFISTKRLDLNRLNISTEHEVLGKFREGHEFVQLFIECINGYAGVTSDGEIDNTISGMALTASVTPDEYAHNDFEYYVNEPTAQGTIRRTVVRTARRQ